MRSYINGDGVFDSSNLHRSGFWFYSAKKALFATFFPNLKFIDSANAGGMFAAFSMRKEQRPKIGFGVCKPACK